MKIKVTGSLRDIANSAWISTTSEINTRARTDEDVDRVVSFLAKNMHTSPFECVSITLVSTKRGDLGDGFINNKFARTLYRDQTYHVTMDLLNFAKTCNKNKDNKCWGVFSKMHPEISEKLSLFDFDNFGKRADTISDNSFEDIKVELINVHETDFETHNRITWRVRCPLSIAVQVLRHRTASFNMVSGRYKTIKQEPYSVPNDISKIASVSSELKERLNTMCADMQTCVYNYSEFMLSLKRSKKDNLISNDEYKRMREFVRFSLPEGRMTELYITFYQDDFEHFLKLRDSDHAQIEHIWLAQKMNETLKTYLKK